MKHSQPLQLSDWWRVAEYARGGLSVSAMTEMELHLAECGVCRTELEEMSELLLKLDEEPADAQVPSPAQQEGNFQRLWKKTQAAIAASEASEKPLSPQTWKQWTPDEQGLRRAEDLEWEATAIDGIEVKRLFVTEDQEYVTMQIRMAPGTEYPAHRHGGNEQCFVLKGDLHAGPRVMHAGDFEIVPEGSIHPKQWTENGCELFIVSSTKDELLEV